MRANITGTATFQSVDIRPGDGGLIEVSGYYHGDVTTYEAPPDAVYIGGLPVTDVGGLLTLEPTEGENYLWVESTGDELHITKTERDNE